jgi:hypothetical protein
MSLNYMHESVEDIPEQYRDLYTEQDGKFLLTGVGGIKTEGDVVRVQEALRKEREEHKSVKQALNAWDGLSPDEVRAKLDRISELEVMANGKVDDTKLEELAEARVRSRLAPVERELQKTRKDQETLLSELQQLRNERIQRSVHDKVREAADRLKIRPEAMADVLLLADAVFESVGNGEVLTKDNPFGVAPGLNPSLWLQDMQDKRPHWWPSSTGGGASGSGGQGFAKNPWSADHWNMTEQGRLLREHGESRAEQMARAAGTTLGGMKPSNKK